MYEKTIKLLMHNPTDKQLLSNYLISLGYEVNESMSDEWSKFSMILTDEYYARQFGQNLLFVKNHPSTIFLPVIIMLPVMTNAATWIEAGYDDVLVLPIRKQELANRLNIFMRLRQQIASKYQFIFENIAIGFYWMSVKNRIISANLAFSKILNYRFPEQVLNKNLSELGVTFSDNREVFLKKLAEKGKIFGYESYWKLNDGNDHYIRENATLLKDQDNNDYYIGTIEDITQDTKYSK